MATKNTGIPYEHLIYSIYSTALKIQGIKNSKVLHNQKITGLALKSGHQVDVYWEFELAGILHRVAVQAKDWKSGVPVGEVRNFKGVLDDLPGQVRGIMIARIGFQSGALEYANSHGIEMCTLKEFRTDEKPENQVVRGPQVGVRNKILLTEHKVYPDQQWYARDPSKADILWKAFGARPDAGFLCDKDQNYLSLMTEAFNEIQIQALITQGEGEFVHRFSKPTYAKTNEMKQPVVLQGVSAKVTLLASEEIYVEVQLRELFSHVLSQVIGNKEYYIDDTYVLHEKSEKEPILCDFCSVPIWGLEEQNAFQTTAFMLANKIDGRINPEYFAAGGWGACEPCGMLIRKNAKSEVVDRTLSIALKSTGDSLEPKAIEAIRAKIEDIQTGFWNAHEAWKRENNLQ